MTDIDHLVGEFDAYKWADGWLQVLAEHPEIATDRDTMQTWFANAIMSGYEHGVQEERKRPLLEKVHEVIFQAVGAGTAPLLEDHGDYVFPSERVVANVERVLTEFGIPTNRDEWTFRTPEGEVPREQGYRGDPGPMTPMVTLIGIATKAGDGGQIFVGMAGDFDALVEAGCEPVMADGGLVAKETYPELYAVLGDRYGEVAEAMAMFRLPDLTGRVIQPDRLDKATHAEMAPPHPKGSAYHNPPTEEG
jgi:hypothetical protein